MAVPAEPQCRGPGRDGQLHEGGGGVTSAVHHVVPAGSRATVKVNDDVGPGVNVSIQATAAAPFIAERPMYFNYGGKWDGGHVVVGAREPSFSWFFAEGYTGPGFEEWLCLQNPSSSIANVSLRYLLEDGTVVPRSFSLAPHSRSTIQVNGDVGPDKEVSMQITSDVPIVAERPIYFNYGSWGRGRQQRPRLHPITCHCECHRERSVAIFSSTR